MADRSTVTDFSSFLTERCTLPERVALNQNSNKKKHQSRFKQKKNISTTNQLTSSYCRRSHTMSSCDDFFKQN